MLGVVRDVVLMLPPGRTGRGALESVLFKCSRCGRPRQWVAQRGTASGCVLNINACGREFTVLGHQ